MLLACGYCKSGNLSPTQNERHVPIEGWKMAHLIQCYCLNCGSFVEFDKDKLVYRDGTYGFKGTGD